jgi:hypothetical protein
MPPSTYRCHAARATAGMPPCVAKQGDQTDQESRSADPRAAANMTAKDVTIHASFLPHDDPDASPDLLSRPPGGGPGGPPSLAGWSRLRRTANGAIGIRAIGLSISASFVSYLRLSATCPRSSL